MSPTSIDARRFDRQSGKTTSSTVHFSGRFVDGSTNINAARAADTSTEHATQFRVQVPETHGVRFFSEFLQQSVHDLPLRLVRILSRVHARLNLHELASYGTYLVILLRFSFLFLALFRETQGGRCWPLAANSNFHKHRTKQHSHESRPRHRTQQNAARHTARVGARNQPVDVFRTATTTQTVTTGTPLREPRAHGSEAIQVRLFLA